MLPETPPHRIPTTSRAAPATKLIHQSVQNLWRSRIRRYGAYLQLKQNSRARKLYRSGNVLGIRLSGAVGIYEQNAVFFVGEAKKL